MSSWNNSANRKRVKYKNNSIYYKPSQNTDYVEIVSDYRPQETQTKQPEPIQEKPSITKSLKLDAPVFKPKNSSTDNTPKIPVQIMPPPAKEIGIIIQQDKFFFNNKFNLNPQNQNMLVKTLHSIPTPHITALPQNPLVNPYLNGHKFFDPEVIVNSKPFYPTTLQQQSPLKKKLDIHAKPYMPGRKENTNISANREFNSSVNEESKIPYIQDDQSGFFNGNQFKKDSGNNIDVLNYGNQFTFTDFKLENKQNESVFRRDDFNSNEFNAKLELDVEDRNTSKEDEIVEKILEENNSVEIDTNLLPQESQEIAANNNDNKKEEVEERNVIKETRVEAHNNQNIVRNEICEMEKNKEEVSNTNSQIVIENQNNQATEPETETETENTKQDVKEKEITEENEIVKNENHTVETEVIVNEKLETQPARESENINNDNNLPQQSGNQLVEDSCDSKKQDQEKEEKTISEIKEHIEQKEENLGENIPSENANITENTQEQENNQQEDNTQRQVNDPHIPEKPNERSNENAEKTDDKVIKLPSEEHIVFSDPRLKQQDSKHHGNKESVIVHKSVISQDLTEVINNSINPQPIINQENTDEIINTNVEKEVPKEDSNRNFLRKTTFLSSIEPGLPLNNSESVPSAIINQEESTTNIKSLMQGKRRTLNIVTENESIPIEVPAFMHSSRNSELSRRSKILGIGIEKDSQKTPVSRYKELVSPRLKNLSTSRSSMSKPDLKATFDNNKFKYISFQKPNMIIEEEKLNFEESSAKKNMPEKDNLKDTDTNEKINNDKNISNTSNKENKEPIQIIENNTLNTNTDNFKEENNLNNQANNSLPVNETTSERNTNVSEGKNFQKDSNDISSSDANKNIARKMEFEGDISKFSTGVSLNEEKNNQKGESGVKTSIQQTEDKKVEEPANEKKNLNQLFNKNKQNPPETKNTNNSKRRNKGKGLTTVNTIKDSPAVEVPVKKEPEYEILNIHFKKRKGENQTSSKRIFDEEYLSHFKNVKFRK